MKKCSNKDCPVPADELRFYYHKVNKRPMSKCMVCHREVATAYYHKNRLKILEQKAVQNQILREMRTL